VKFHPGLGDRILISVDPSPEAPAQAAE
jgi:hypothetical protein